MAKKKFKVTKKKQAIAKKKFKIRRKEIGVDAKGVEIRPPSHFAPPNLPPPNIPKPPFAFRDRLIKAAESFMYRCFEKRTESHLRKTNAERRLVMEEYEQFFGEEPPAWMHWHLVKARIMSHSQYLVAKDNGKEKELKKGFWHNYRAAWSRKVEKNDVSEFDELSRFLFRVLMDVPKVEPEEETEMAAKKKSKSKKSNRNLKEIFGSSVAAMVRRLGKEDYGFKAAIAFLQKQGIRNPSEAMVRTYLYAGKSGTRGDPAPLTKTQRELVKKFNANFTPPAKKASKKKVTKKASKKATKKTAKKKVAKKVSKKKVVVKKKASKE